MLNGLWLSFFVVATVGAVTIAHSPRTLCVGQFVFAALPAPLSLFSFSHAH